MNRIQEAYRLVFEFEEIASDVSLGSSDLAKITKVMQEPNYAALRLFLAIGAEKSSTAQWMADRKYHERPDHNCYKNDSFCIAHLFELDSKRKRECTLWLIENSMAGYYEPVTHSGFRLSDMLYDMGAIDHPLSGGGYLALRLDRILTMANHFQISNKEIEDCAENVIKWSLNRGYAVETETSFSASSALGLNEIERVAKMYLPHDRQKSLLPLYAVARENLRDPEKTGVLSRITPKRV
jgi:hypothetical protein